jgi:hypothetical protein
MLRVSVYMRIGIMKFISNQSFVILNYNCQKRRSDYFQDSLLNAKICLIIQYCIMPGWKLGHCIEKPYLFNKKINLFEEKRLLTGKKTLLSSEKTLLIGKKTLLSGEKTLLTGEKSLLLRENTHLTGNKTLLTGKETNLIHERI